MKIKKREVLMKLKNEGWDLDMCFGMLIKKVN